MWIAEHLADILIVAAIVLACVFILRGRIRDRRAGKSCCDGNCASCPGSGSCRDRGKAPGK